MNAEQEDRAYKFAQETTDESVIDKSIAGYLNAPDTKVGRKQKEKFLKELTDQAAISTKAALDYEIRALQEMGGLNVDFLTTDSKGSRTMNQLFLGKPFSTGVATRCVTIAAIHKDVGMGASHRNTVTSSIVESTMKRFLDDLVSAQLVDPESLDFGLQMTPLGSLKQTTQQTLHEALGELASISEKNTIPTTGEIQILATGMDFLDEKNVGILTDSLIDFVRNDSFLQTPLSTRSVSLHSNFGIGQGIIFGGRNHPEYSKPAFYTIIAK